jgi:hypothetical protein
MGNVSANAIKHMSQKHKIIELLGSGMWVCSRELAANYMVDYRSVINKLRKEGYIIETKRCDMHHHDGKMNMWRLISIPKYETLQEGENVVLQRVMF